MVDAKRGWKEVFLVILSVWVISFIAFIINHIFNGVLNNYGLLPRHVTHLSNIVVYPFIHGSWTHLFFNLSSFTLLALGVGVNGVARLLNVILLCWLLGSISVWLFGRISYHVGLSGIIYGIWGYLLIYGLVLRSLLSLIITFLVMIYFSSMIWGVFPMNYQVSFESHLFGAIAGGFVGYFLGKKDAAKLNCRFDEQP
ncbi:rhomboid family intramembrane serine protease [Photobacterium leiognathi]|uniref:Rhomboid family intramembrane serine protease n=1 Tax=Photobacterium leiognathi subsp. mandapamensis TaxID=48408 RepID=A0A2T3KRC1_PHOLD|nr:rhomboid family intramembrane serine protease [Photobacterium leiognathi]PSV01966.1 rhomboid family intramembrane serine protease [Photobacterium leiognathi subsp. mandapamensis]PSV08833.1 rhomboid family intramembrane serine protease [Photobacterium leiognathi subsp. mandapamensis]PSW54796.1 rhomboid family intramembrane serine protease [Photobacterium leiognathi subsp. mandapamensis]GAA06627.1 rhomboid family protein [Photobacterium leiognathi subsp. mandapamensis svers.1.1.]